MTALESEVRYLLYTAPTASSADGKLFATAEFTNQFGEQYLFHRLPFHEYRPGCTIRWFPRAHQ